jgi:uncharacterized membrane protein
MSRLVALVDANVLSRDAWERACQLAGHTPREQSWIKFISRAVLTLGVIFIISGVIFFSAYNWVEPHRFVVFGSIQAIMLGLIAFIHFWGIDNLVGKMALLAASMLIGVLLAVIGQEYQTGADAYQLFTYWALLLIAWVVVARWGPLWLVWLVIANIAMSLYGEQIVGEHRDAGIFIAAIVLNSAALAAWEWGQARAIAWLQARWIPNLIGTAILALATYLVIDWLFYDGYYDWQAQTYRDSRYFALNLAPFIYAGVILGIAVAYYRWKHDLYTLAAGGISLIIMTTAAIIFLFDEFDVDTGAEVLACVAGLVIIAETAALAQGLIYLHNRWEDET